MPSGAIATIVTLLATVLVWILGMVARQLIVSCDFVMVARRHAYLDAKEFMFDLRYEEGDGKRHEFSDLSILGYKDKTYRTIAVLTKTPLSLDSRIQVLEKGGKPVLVVTGTPGASITVSLQALPGVALQDFSSFFLAVSENGVTRVAKFKDLSSTKEGSLRFKKKKINLLSTCASDTESIG